MARTISQHYRVCPACGGSLQDSIDDPGWVKCFSCSRSFDSTTIRGESTVAAPPPVLDELSFPLSEAKRRIAEHQDANEAGTSHPYIRRVLH